jgi:Uma2 family endonuclease
VWKGSTIHPVRLHDPRRTVSFVELRAEPGTTLLVPMSREEYEALPEQKHAEWWDGVCVVNAPVPHHGRIVGRLVVLLGHSCPSGSAVYVETGWRTQDADFGPDIALASDEASGVWLLEAPLLVVEVLSPSTRRFDLGYKFEAYARNGAAWYWVVDPDVPSLTVHRNDNGAYAEVQRIDEPHDTIGPIAVHFDPEAICR